MRKTIRRIDNQEKQIQNLTESMRKSQKAIDILQRYQASHISMLYSLQTYQTAMQTRLLKTTVSILNTLQLINTQKFYLDIIIFQNNPEKISENEILHQN